MKEWAFKHPIMTFFLVDAAIAGVVNICRLAIDALGKGTEEETKEEKEHEPAGDIQ